MFEHIFIRPDWKHKMSDWPRFTLDAELGTHIDDEYANAAEKDPKILLTTSRNPSSRLTQFVKVGTAYEVA